MKYIFYSLLTALLFTLSISVFAQTPPPPNNGSSGGPGTTPVGGGAPIEGGWLILSALGMAYGAKKVLNINIMKLAE